MTTGKILALDVGERRVGLAISDPTGLLASPFGAVERGPDDISDIARIAEDNEVVEIVVGLPISMSGESGAQAGRVRAFIRDLRRATDVSITTLDERLSTVQAERMLRDSGRSARHRSRERGRVDAAAAAVILQARLDSRR